MSAKGKTFCSGQKRNWSEEDEEEKEGGGGGVGVEVCY